MRVEMFFKRCKKSLEVTMRVKYSADEYLLIRKVAARYVGDGKYLPSVCNMGSKGVEVDDDGLAGEIEKERENPTRAGDRKTPVAHPVKSVVPCPFCGCTEWDTRLPSESSVEHRSGSPARVAEGKSQYGTSRTYLSRGTCVSCGSGFILKWGSGSLSHSSHERVVAASIVDIRQGL